MRTLPSSGDASNLDFHKTISELNQEIEDFFGPQTQTNPDQMQEAFSSASQDSTTASQIPPSTSKLTHVDASGRAAMVDVSQVGRGSTRPF